MQLQPELSPQKTGPDTRIGVAVRVVFFVATLYVSLRLSALLLYTVFNAIVAGTIGLLAAGLIANLLTMRIFDRRPFTDIGLRAGKASGINLALGVALGAGAAALMLVAPIAGNAAHLVSRSGEAPSWGTLVFYFVALAAAASGEEMMFRGYAFQLLIDKIGPFATVLPVAVIFGLAHNANPHSNALGLLNTVLWGVVLGVAFLRSRDLWLPIGLHYGWNVVLPLFGVNLSGLTIGVTRYHYQWNLLPLWSGGDYGPEGGLLATIFIIAVFFAVLKAPVRPQPAAIARNLND